MLKDTEFEPDCPERLWFSTDFTVEALVRGLAVAGVAADPVFAKSSVSTRHQQTCVAICRTNKSFSSVQMCFLLAKLLLFTKLL